jgi:hypothetical protein
MGVALARVVERRNPFSCFGGWGGGGAELKVGGCLGVLGMGGGIGLGWMLNNQAGGGV